MNKRRVVWGLGVVAAVATAAATIAHFAGWPQREPKHLNVLLITLDTTRADHLGCYGRAEARTPTLDGLAAQGTMFEQAFSPVPLTLPAHASVMTGLNPPEHGVRINGELKLDLPSPTLAELLRQKGYQTGAFVSAVVLDSAHALDRGFDVYSDEISDKYKELSEEPMSAYRPGKEVADDALGWLAKRDRTRPFFCWAHFFDPHKPYFSHEELAGTPLSGKATYDGEVAYMDIQVGRLMAYLRQEGLLENTLVIAFGDHGEGLGEHEEEAHGYMLYETTLRVPVIVSLPGKVAKGHREKATISLIDLFATVQDVLGFAPVDERSGRSLAGALYGHEIESLPCYSETMMTFSSFHWSPLWSLTKPDWKYIRSAKLHLYDRAADPHELDNLAEPRRDTLERLERELKDLEQQMVVHEAQEADMTAKDIARLEALGYVSGGKKHFDGDTMDYAALHDIEDMLHVFKMIPQGRELEKQNRQDEFMALLSQMIAQSPETTRFHSRMVSELVKLGQYEEALKEAMEVNRLDPDDHEMCHTIGTIHATQGRPVEAVKWYRKVIRLKPDFALAHEELARSLRRCGDAAGADRHAAQGWKLPDEVVENYDLGIVLGNVGLYAEALEHLQAAVKAAPDDPVVRAGFGMVLEWKGDAAAAEKEYAEALRLEPGEPRHLYAMGSVLGKQGRWGEATEYLSKFVQAKPEDIGGRTNLGLVLGKQGKYAEARAQFAEAIRLKPDNAQIYVAKGGILEAEGKTAEAVEAFREAHRLSPARADLASHLARILATSPDDTVRNGAEAVRLAEQARAATKDADATLLDTLAAAYAEAGRFGDAAVTAKTAMERAVAEQNEELAGQIRLRLALYEAGRPYREKPAAATTTAPG